MLWSFQCKSQQSQQCNAKKGSGAHWQQFKQRTLNFEHPANPPSQLYSSLSSWIFIDRISWIVPGLATPLGTAGKSSSTRTSHFSIWKIRLYFSAILWVFKTSCKTLLHFEIQLYKGRVSRLRLNRGAFSWLRFNRILSIESRGAFVMVLASLLLLYKG
jgi:hypothetical protein